MYYDTSVSPAGKIVLKWNTISSSKIYITTSNDKLTGETSSYYSSALSMWNSACSSNLSIVDASFSSAKADFATPTESSWQYYVDDPYDEMQMTGKVTFAYTDIYDTNGLQIKSVSTAKSSTKLISSAAIYVNPYPSAWDGEVVNEVSNTQKKYILAHELGHVMGIWHSDTGPYASSVASIMKASAFAMSTSITPHDISDVTAHKKS